MRGASLGLLAALALAALPLPAIEKLSAELERERPTSNADAVSLKPLMTFTMRHRGDPFMDYVFLTNTPPGSFTDINDLVYSGTLGVEGKTVAIFRGVDSTTFYLRGNVLYDPQDKPVEGIRGSIIQGAGSDDVILVQGDQKLEFSATRRSKRLTMDSQP